ncbi:tuftelin-interacting protein 11-like [Oppia nitens]|uniref:tuftelin-interacting protein 11-like n=1 Tax=Oppia nitens TaxID=1686743 RepID=UPI0023DABD27|nr:tuftelin-interacting protein 11-like [Oppia nitens]
MADDDQKDGRIEFGITDWDIDNEFAGARGRQQTKSKKQLKKEAIYGVFATSDSDGDDGKDDNIRGGGRGSSRESTRNEPQKAFSYLNFEKATKISEEVKQEFSEDNKNDIFVDEMLADDSESLKLKRKQDLRDEKKGFTRDERYFSGVGFGGQTDNEFGRWESYTKGIGAKLLAKMGYKPGKGLGKNLQGIAAPIEAKQRLGSGAIGLYGPEHKHRVMTEEEEADDKLKTQKKMKVENKWKQTERAVKRAKNLVKSADDIIAENLVKPIDTNETSKMKVIDMTGPEQRVLIGYHQISQSANPSFEDEMNDDLIDSLKDGTESEIIQNTKELRQESYRLKTLEEEIERISEVNEEETKIYKNLEFIYGLIDDLSTKLNDNKLTFEEIFEKYDQLRSDYSVEFYSLDLQDLIIPTAFPLVRQLLTDWQPLTDSEGSRKIDMFMKLKKMLDTTDDSIFEIILWELWMPVVRRSLLDWSSIRQCDEIIAFLESWKPIQPIWLFDNIIEQIVLPLLQKEVDEWNPLTDTMPIHSWLHPWLPLMADRSLEHIYDPIRHKLAQALINWHPSDSSAKLILEPWKGVFSYGSMEGFLNTNIVPKLELALQSLIINPHQQCLDIWHWIMSWQEMLSTTMMAAILDKNFFPRWLNVLYNWLTNKANLDEVSKWYTGWKSMLSPQLLDHPIVKDSLRRALDIMSAFTNNTGIPVKPFHAFYAPIKPPPPPPSQTSSSTTSLSSDTSINFRQLVERRAEDKGILFMPIANRLYEGKQVYKFGKQIIFIDRQVLFIMNSNDNKWIPTSLQSLIDSAF